MKNAYQLLEELEDQLAKRHTTFVSKPVSPNVSKPVSPKKYTPPKSKEESKKGDVEIPEMKTIPKSVMRSVVKSKSKDDDTLGANSQFEYDSETKDFSRKSK